MDECGRVYSFCLPVQRLFNGSRVSSVRRNTSGPAFPFVLGNRLDWRMASLAGCERIPALGSAQQPAPVSLSACFLRDSSALAVCGALLDEQPGVSTSRAGNDRDSGGISGFDGLQPVRQSVLRTLLSLRFPCVSGLENSNIFAGRRLVMLLHRFGRALFFVYENETDQKNPHSLLMRNADQLEIFRFEFWPF